MSPLAAAALVLSWRLELWSLVMGIVAAAVVFARSYVEQHRRWLPALLATRAFAGVEGADADRVPAELAVLSKGRTATLERAAGLVHDDPDPDRWELAVERLAVATDLLVRGGVPGVSQQPAASTRALAVWSGLGTLVLVVAVASASRWWLIPPTIAFVALVVNWTDLREERQWGPALVAAEARSRRPAQVVPACDHDVAVSLALLAGGHRGSVLRAIQLLALSAQPGYAKAQAAARLRTAEILLAGGGTVTRIASQLAWPCSGAGVAAVVMWWATA